MFAVKSDPPRLDDPILKFSDDPRDAVVLRDSLRACLIVRGMSSGKPEIGAESEAEKYQMEWKIFV